MTNAQLEDFKGQKLIEVINYLNEKNLFKTLVQIGLISLVYYDYLQIWNAYQNYRKAGVKKMQAYENVSFDFHCSSEKIRLVISKLQDPA